MKHDPRLASMQIGKHRGKTLGWLADNYPSYLRWYANRRPADRFIKAAEQVVNEMDGKPNAPLPSDVEHFVDMMED